MTITTLHLKEALASIVYTKCFRYDRAIAHLFILNKVDEITPKASKLTMLVAEHRLESPKMRYNAERQCVYQQEYDIANDIESEWLPLEEYKEFNPEVTKIIKNLK